MEKLIRKSWWKVVAVVILVYVMVMGMLVPLKPGISAVDPSAARTGEIVTINIYGYNTHLSTELASTRVWLKLDERAMLASQLVAPAEDHLQATFRLPAHLPSSESVQPLTLVVDNVVDGAFVRPDAVLVTQDSIDPARGAALWNNQPLSDLHQRAGITFPFRTILGETIRNTYFHVSLWLAMVILFIAAVVYSIRYLRGSDLKNDHWANALTASGVLFGLLGLVTGAVWARYTWGAFWSWDIKQFTTLIALIIYLAYFVLRAVFPDPEQRARIGAVYNIFAFTALIPLIYVLPRLTDSLHPGNGGNPALGGEDLDSTMRMVFYPAVIGWTLFGAWLASLYYRIQRLRERLFDLEYEA